MQIIIPIPQGWFEDCLDVLNDRMVIQVDGTARDVNGNCIIDYILLWFSFVAENSYGLSIEKPKTFSSLDGHKFYQESAEYLSHYYEEVHLSLCNAHKHFMHLENVSLSFILNDPTSLILKITQNHGATHEQNRPHAGRVFV
jgi:hypothetical protein